MTITELPIQVQKRLARLREELKSVRINTPYKVLIYDEEARRYFEAYRKSIGTTWAGFGGGSYWKVRYGAVQISRGKDPFGGVDYSLCNGKAFGKSANGVVIPQRVETKKEVLEIIKKLGIFSIN